MYIKEIINIIVLTLFVNITSTLIAMAVGIIISYILYKKSFKGKDLLLSINRTLMSLPPVVLGLFLFILFSKNGPLGFFKMLFTVKILILAQVLLITPIIVGHCYNLFCSHKNMFTSLHSLGARGFELLKVCVLEMKKELVFILLIGFSRAVSEVGAVMIVGGNIRHKTRLMTTTISMTQSMGDYYVAISLGVVLLMISFLIQYMLQKLSGDEIDENL